MSAELANRNTRPSAQKRVEFLHDLLDRHQQTGSGRDRPDRLGPLVQWCEDHRPYQPMRFDFMLKQGVSFHVRRWLKEMVCR